MCVTCKQSSLSPTAAFAELVWADTTAQQEGNLVVTVVTAPGFVAGSVLLHVPSAYL